MVSESVYENDSVFKRNENKKLLRWKRQVERVFAYNRFFQTRLLIYTDTLAMGVIVFNKGAPQVN